MKKGFTLIELLVVVLIIGILSAVALPQYQTAVDKTKVMTAFQLGRSVKMAEEAYYLANGKYTTNQEELDLSFSDGTGNSFVKNGWTFLLRQASNGGGIPWSVYVTNDTIGVLLIIGYDHDRSGWAGRAACYAMLSKGERGKKACRSLSGKAEPDQKQEPDYWVYNIQL